MSLNEPALATLEAHRGQLMSFVRRRVGDSDVAEEILQEGLLRSLRSDKEPSTEGLLPWFHQILRNLIIDHYRKAGAEQRKLDSAIVQLDQDMKESATEQELCQCFMDLLPALKPEYAELIRRIDLGEESPDQVAASLGIEKNNLKVRRHRAKNSLKEHLIKACRLCARHGCLDCDCSSKSKK